MGFKFFPLLSDYINGGELFTHLYQRDKFSEDETRIYIAEIIIAIEHLHKVWRISLVFTQWDFPKNY
jgi:serine/threonine protein kinase